MYTTVSSSSDRLITSSSTDSHQFISLVGDRALPLLSTEGATIQMTTKIASHTRGGRPSTGAIHLQASAGSHATPRRSSSLRTISRNISKIPTQRLRRLNSICNTCSKVSMLTPSSGLLFSVSVPLSIRSSVSNALAKPSIVPQNSSWLITHSNIRSLMLPVLQESEPALEVCPSGQGMQSVNLCSSSGVNFPALHGMHGDIGSLELPRRLPAGQVSQA